MRPVLAAACAALVLGACSQGEEPPAPRPRPPAEGDAALVVQALDGTLPADELFSRVSRSGGWPIATSQGFLFVTLDEGVGPYQVRSPTGAFPATPMNAEAGLAWALVPITAPAGLAYEFVTRYGDAFANGWSRYLEYPGGAERMLVRASPPGLVRFHGVGGAGITPRTLRLWVPAGVPTHFLYVHDGQNLFRPGATTFGYWELQRGAGPATLLVGIDNSSARADEYGTGPLGEAYADYVEEVVRPFVESRYGTPARVGVMGASRGGLVSYFQAYRHPGSYDFVASLSGVMGKYTGTATPIIALFEPLAACPEGVFYLDSGGGPPPGGCVDADLDGILDDTLIGYDFYCQNTQMRDLLQTLGCGSRSTYVYSENAPHNEGAWRARSPAILDLFEAL